MASDNKKNPPFKIDIKDDVALGHYSNVVFMAHTPVEMILDFGAVLPLKEGAQVVSRIIMIPEHAKRFLLALADNIRQYEQQFGEINVHRPQQGGGGTVAPFGLPQGEA